MSVIGKDSSPYYGARVEEYEDVYEKGELKDGSKYEVLKNFPSVNDIHAELALVSALKVTELQYYWIAQYIQT